MKEVNKQLSKIVPRYPEPAGKVEKLRPMSSTRVKPANKDSNDIKHAMKPEKQNKTVKTEKREQIKEDTELEKPFKVKTA